MIVPFPSTAHEKEREKERGQNNKEEGRQNKRGAEGPWGERRLAGGGGKPQSVLGGKTKTKRKKPSRAKEHACIFTRDV